MRIATICVVICFVMLFLVLSHFIQEKNNEGTKRAYEVTVIDGTQDWPIRYQIQVDSLVYFSDDHIIAYRDNKSTEIKAVHISFSRDWSVTNGKVISERGHTR